MNTWSELAAQVADRITKVGDSGPAHPRQRVPRKGSDFRDLFTSDIDGRNMLRGWVVAPGRPVGTMEPLALGSGPLFEEDLSFLVRGFSAIDESEDSFTDFLDVARTVQFQLGLWRGWDLGEDSYVEVKGCSMDSYTTSRFGDAIVWAVTISLALRVTHKLSYEGSQP